MADQPMSNSAALTAQFDSEVAEIKKMLADADRSKAGHRKSLNSALDRAFNLTSDLIADGNLDLFAEHNGFKLGKVARDNPFQPVTKFLFRDLTDDSVSKYATVLNYARHAKNPSQPFLKWLEESGGLNEAAKAARQAKSRSKFYDLLNETLDVFLNRAKNHVRQNPKGAVSVTQPDDIPSAGEFHRALVRIVDGQIELCGFSSSDEKDIERDLKKLVPPQPLAAVETITLKPAYPLFRLIDIATRFTELGQKELDAWVRSLDASAKRQPAKGSLPTFMQYGILLTCNEGVWFGSTTSKAQTFPYVEAPLEMPLDGLDQRKKYLLSMEEVGRFMDQYLRQSDWKILVGKRPKGAPANALYVEELDLKEGWRTKTPPFSQTPEATIRLGRLDALTKAAAHYRPSQLIRLGAEPHGTTLTIKAENGDHKSWPLLDGKLDDQVRAELEGRWFERDDLTKLYRLAVDYGCDLEAAFVEGYEGHAVALEVKAPDEVEITLPVVVALDGSRASIAQPV